LELKIYLKIYVFNRIAGISFYSYCGFANFWIV